VALGGISKQALIMIWAVVTLIVLFSALRVEATALSLWLKRAAGVVLIATALIHMLRFAPADPVIWSVDISLFACGGVLLWLTRRAVLRPMPAVSQ
jgi:hypothetical protein